MIKPWAWLLHVWHGWVGGREASSLQQGSPFLFKRNARGFVKVPNPGFPATSSVFIFRRVRNHRISKGSVTLPLKTQMPRRSACGEHESPGWV